MKKTIGVTLLSLTLLFPSLSIAYLHKATNAKVSQASPVQRLYPSAPNYGFSYIDDYTFGGDLVITNDWLKWFKGV